MPTSAIVRGVMSTNGNRRPHALFRGDDPPGVPEWLLQGIWPITRTVGRFKARRSG